MTEKEKAGIVRRLHRISGQIAGIEKMVGDGAPEEEILIQINAVKQASHRVGQLLLQSRVNECIHAVAEGKAADEAMEEYQKAMEFYSRM